MDLRIKKCMYLLFAFQNKNTIDFFKKNSHLVKDTPVSLQKLVKKMQLSFLKNRSLNFKSVDVIWHAFLKKTSYEEACVVAFTTAGYSVKDLAWILKLSPEVLGFRLKRGLLALGGEVLKKREPVSSSPQVLEEEKTLQAAQEYCRQLKTTVSVPMDLQALVFKSKPSLLWFFVLGVLGIALAAWVFQKLWDSDQHLILYQTPF